MKNMDLEELQSWEIEIGFQTYFYISTISLPSNNILWPLNTQSISLMKMVHLPFQTYLAKMVQFKVYNN